MKKIGLVGIVAGALTGAVIGFAAPAQAGDGSGFGYGFNGHDSGYPYEYGYADRDRSYNPWLDRLYPNVKVPHVDTSVHN